MRGGERTGPPVAAVGGPRRYNGLVPATDEGDESGATRPPLLTTQAKAVLVVWGTVTLVLVITYAVVLVLL
jgi:hypothetical protein